VANLSIDDYDGCTTQCLQDNKHVLQDSGLNKRSTFQRTILRLNKEMELLKTIFVLGSKPVSMRELAELVIRKVGKGHLNFSPASNKVFDQFTDHSKVASVLGWAPAVGIEEVVNRVIDDIRSTPVIDGKQSLSPN